MLKYRFNPYIVGLGIVIFVLISCVGYRAYHNHREFQAVMSEAESFYRSIEYQHDHSSHEHTHHGGAASVASDAEDTRTGEQADSGEEHPSFVSRTEDGHYVYKIAGMTYSSDSPMTQKQIEIKEWLYLGKKTPSVEEAIRDAERFRENFKDKVIQRVVTPDGQLHQVIVPRWTQYEEGDAILESELDSPMIEMAALAQKPWLKNRVEIDDVWHSPPEEYYSIEDPYEREVYMNKFTWSVQYGISMAEVEKKVAAGELEVSLSEADKRRIDKIESSRERRRMLQPEPLSLSDKPPVKVKFLPDGDDMPGWLRKHNPRTGSEEVGNGGAHSSAETVSKGSAPLDTDADLVHTTGYRIGKSIPLSLAPIEGSQKTSPPPAESIKTQQYREGLSPERFDKAQQLIDQYGTEEGLRRLRAMDPEAARQFEREQHKPKMNTEP